ncbi:MAG: response regulator [Synechococcales cyanobacterium T60_A2020_003]|nr:response regulator [Synechococcales cyanobacterium T60_A2020_003]
MVFSGSIQASTPITQVEQLPYLVSIVDLILIDIQLEETLDGIATAAQLRDRGIRVPIIFLTASTGTDTLQRAIATEPFGYLIKPFHPTELYGGVTTHGIATSFNGSVNSRKNTWLRP